RPAVDGDVRHGQPLLLLERDVCDLAGDGRQHRRGQRPAGQPRAGLRRGLTVSQVTQPSTPGAASVRCASAGLLAGASTRITSARLAPLAVPDWRRRLTPRAAALTRLQTARRRAPFNEWRMRADDWRTLTESRAVAFPRHGGCQPPANTGSICV